MQPNYIFKSERLGFREWQDTDLPAFAAMNADEDVMEFFPALMTLKQSKNMLQRLQQNQQQNGYCFYAADQLSTNEFIGFIGLHYQTMEADFTPCTEIGWRLKKSAWGNGFATEGAKACLDFAFTKLGIDKVYSFTAIPNKKSEKVMQKIGMKKIGEFIHPKLEKSHWLAPHLLYLTEKSPTKPKTHSIED